MGDGGWVDLKTPEIGDYGSEDFPFLEERRKSRFFAWNTFIPNVYGVYTLWSFIDFEKFGNIFPGKKSVWRKC